jgi:hypothetical protein
MTATEYGLFNDEGCVERGLWSRAEAERELARYSDEDELTAKALCEVHDEQAADDCEECFAETCDECGETVEDCGCERCDECGEVEARCECECDDCGDRLSECACL